MLRGAAVLETGSRERICVPPSRVAFLRAVVISWELSSGLEGNGTAASAVFSDH